MCTEIQVLSYQKNYYSQMLYDYEFFMRMLFNNNKTKLVKAHITIYRILL